MGSALSRLPPTLSGSHKACAGTAYRAKPYEKSTRCCSTLGDPRRLSLADRSRPEARRLLRARRLVWSVIGSPASARGPWGPVGSASRRSFAPPFGAYGSGLLGGPLLGGPSLVGRRPVPARLVCRAVLRAKRYGGVGPPWSVRVALMRPGGRARFAARCGAPWPLLLPPPRALSGRWRAPCPRTPVGACARRGFRARGPAGGPGAFARPARFPCFWAPFPARFFAAPGPRFVPGCVLPLARFGTAFSAPRCPFQAYRGNETDAAYCSPPRVPPGSSGADRAD